MKHTRSTLASDSATRAFPELAPADESGPLAEQAPTPSLARLQDRQSQGQLKATTLSFETVGDHGNLLVKYLRARKETFIDRLHWDLPNTDGMEFDQYDTPQCRWIIVHEYGEIMGGVRLLPTTAGCGIYSYMLRDAQRGLLDSIPSDVLFLDAPVLPLVWEASRLFITDAVPSRRRNDVQGLLMQVMARTAADAGARYVIGIVPWVFSRWLRRLGLAALPVGPRFTIDGTTSQAALFNVARYLD
ncbi:acyl-homoserine-lactone synthase [Marinibacterium sp. SX1]|uniref:acyl-homoserine-lactone synthase n=1 Tax=Marinibacterium sp. SX1 TaxID=3388424 RepID=UPI003D173462